MQIMWRHRHGADCYRQKIGKIASQWIKGVHNKLYTIVSNIIKTRFPPLHIKILQATQPGILATTDRNKDYETSWVTLAWLIMKIFDTQWKIISPSCLTTVAGPSSPPACLGWAWCVQHQRVNDRSPVRASSELFLTLYNLATGWIKSHY